MLPPGGDPASTGAVTSMVFSDNFSDSTLQTPATHPTDDLTERIPPHPSPKADCHHLQRVPIMWTLP